MQTPPDYPAASPLPGARFTLKHPKVLKGEALPSQPPSDLRSREDPSDLTSREDAGGLTPPRKVGLGSFAVTRRAKPGPPLWFGSPASSHPTYGPGRRPDSVFCDTEACLSLARAEQMRSSAHTAVICPTFCPVGAGNNERPQKHSAFLISQALLALKHSLSLLSKSSQ